MDLFADILEWQKVIAHIFVPAIDEVDLLLVADHLKILDVADDVVEYFFFAFDDLLYFMMAFWRDAINLFSSFFLHFKKPVFPKILEYGVDRAVAGFPGLCELVDFFYNAVSGE